VTPARSPVRRIVRAAIERLPFGRVAAMRLARRIAGRGTGGRQAGPWAPTGSRAAAEPIPERFQIAPRPPVIEGPWPRPPQVESPALVVGRSAQAPRPPVFDVELFEQLNAEYATKPLVPAPRGLDAAASTERARKRLEAVHASIDLAGKRVLEFGCAAGYEVWLVAHRFGADAVGVDIEERSAWDALRGPGVTLVKADVATDRPFPADRFDRIVSSSVFEHVVHPHATANELFRILRPGGFAWVSANLHRGPMASHRYRDVFFPWPHLLFEDTVFQQFYQRQGKARRAAAWVNRLTWAEYEGMFRRIGFRILSLRFSERPIDEPFYERFEDTLSRYPRWDLERDFFHVVLEKPA